MYLGKPSYASGTPYKFELDFSTDCTTIFDILADVNRTLELLRKKPSKRMGSGPIGVGSQWIARFGPFDIGFFKQISRITKYERPRFFSRTLRGSVVCDVDYLFEAISTGTRVTVTLRVRKVPWLTNKAAYEAVQRFFLTRIKEALEQEK